MSGVHHEPEEPADGGLHPVALEEMLAEVRDECERRRRLFPQLAREHKMNHRRAERRIVVMEKLRQMLEELRRGERPEVRAREEGS